MTDCWRLIPKLLDIQRNLKTLTHPLKKKKSIENNSEMIQILELADKNFKLAIITVLNDIKEI